MYYSEDSTKEILGRKNERIFHIVIRNVRIRVVEISSFSIRHVKLFVVHIESVRMCAKIPTNLN